MLSSQAQSTVPDQNREILRRLLKQDRSDHKWIIKSDDEHLVFGEVYVPYELDTEGDFATPEEIKRAFYSFIMSGWMHKGDVEHAHKDDFLFEEDCPIVEFFIVRGDNDPDGFRRGAAVIGKLIQSDEKWEKVKKGEINGFSLFGDSVRVPCTVEADILVALEGDSEPSTSPDFPVHTHTVKAQFDPLQKIIPTKTSLATQDMSGNPLTIPHDHDVLKATATELAHDHGHRFRADEVP